MTNERANYLYEKYVKQELTKEELLEWEDLGIDLNNDHFFQELIAGLWDVKQDDAPSMKIARANEIEHYITSQIQPSVKTNTIIKRLLWQRLAVAVAIVLVLFGAGLFYFSKNNFNNNSSANHTTDIPAGSFGATLTLASGKKIKLSDAQNGELAHEEGISISKNKNGQVVYDISSQGNGSAGQAHNTLTTAKGETYQVRLPDGSLVFLNAASSLTYATSLNSRGERRVKLNGEAYFEISKDKSHPFIVESAGQEVKVLGTHFNINSYANEPVVKTTLLEGAIAVNALSNKPMLLKPGQQSVLSGDIIKISEADVEEAVAWKNELFKFNGRDLESIMKEVARWYDVEVIYPVGRLKSNLHFDGELSRKSNLSTILAVLESTGDVKFEVQGRRVTMVK